MALSNRDRVSRGFDLLAEGLLPFVEHHVSGVAPGDADWLAWLGRKLYPNNPRTKISQHDPQFLLRAIVDQGEIFKGALSRSALSYAQELREYRNDWAHRKKVFDQRDTNRLLDDIERLLREIGATFEADEVYKLLKNFDPRDPGSVHVRRLGVPIFDRMPDAEKAFPAFNLLTGSVAALLWILLLSVMLILLPSTKGSEIGLTVFASLALTVGAVSGYGALFNRMRFAVMATGACLGIVLLASLSVVAGHYAPRHSASGLALEGRPSGKDSRRHTTTSKPVKSLTPRPRASASGSAKATPKVRPVYLSSLTGSGDGDGPETGQWVVSRVPYADSLGYPGLCGEEDVTFQFSPSYRYFKATVGVADGAEADDQETPVTFEVDTGSGDELGSTDAQYGRPTAIKVRVTGISSITLDTDTGSGNSCLYGMDSVAVWGDPELIP